MVRKLKVTKPQRQAIESWRDQAKACWKAGRPDEAEAVYRRILTIDGKDAAAMEALALISVFRGNEDQARRLFERALKCEPGRATALVGLADLHHHAGRFDQARAL